jgi:hypothetical protein
MTARKRPLTPQRDIAEAERRAKAARTPIAKAVTRQVAEKKRRTYSGQGAREAAAQMQRGVHPLAIGTTAKGSAPAKKAKPREK